MTWVAKKPAVYCRPHGRRITAHFDGNHFCDVCLEDWVDEGMKAAWRKAMDLAVKFVLEHTENTA